MRAWKFDNNGIREVDNLWKTLELPVGIPSVGRSGDSACVISLVGGGGKTSTMYELADELAALGKRVIVTTSTHIFRPSNRCVILAESVKELDQGIWDGVKWGGVIVAGRRSAVPDKLTSFFEYEIGLLAVICDVLLIEADGAKCLPFKLPREYEPVIIPQTDVVIGCVGLDCVGASFAEKCFCWQLCGSALGYEVKGTDVIREEDVAAVLLSSQGTRKGAKDGCYRIVINQADEEERLNQAVKIASLVGKKGSFPCAITSYRQQ